MNAGVQSLTLKPRNGTTVSLREHTFLIHAPDADEVFVVGDFNGWDASNNGTLTKGTGGYWALQLQIPNRPQHYLFIVDREPTLDPNAAGSVFYELLGEKVSFLPGGQG